MPVSCWNCANNSKTKLLRIVHPGGHTELHDRPVTAAEIMSRNPRCCIAYPYVFQQPWAIVAPDTVLVVGQKYYVVPMSTIRKLQRLSPRHSPSPARDISISSSAEETRNKQFSRDEEDDGMIHMCCIFGNNSNKYSCKQDSRNKSEKPKIGSTVKYSNTDVKYKSGGLSCDNTLTSRRMQDLTGNDCRGSPKKAWSSEIWQPSLESITEE